MEPGPGNTITDVAGVRVGHVTLIRGDGPLRVGEGPVRTGVTVIVPHDGEVWTEPVLPGRIGSTATASSPGWSGSASTGCSAEPSASPTRIASGRSGMG